MSYAKLWQSLEHEDTNILLVKPKSFELANTTIESDEYHFLFSVMDSFNTDTTTLEQEGSTSANIEQVDSYKTITQSLLRYGELEQFAVPVQWEEDWDRHLIIHQGELATANVEVRQPDKFFDITPRLDRSLIFQLRGCITANIEQEDSNETSSYYLQRREILDRFNILAQREDNWDGYESKKPSKSTLNHAKFLLIEELLDTIIYAGHPWHSPFISSDEDGFITAAWYEEERELHILISKNETEYLQVWGTNIDTEMHEDYLSRDDYLRLWKWLLYG